MRAFPDDGKEVQVSRGGGRLPAWNRSRQEILYEAEDHRLMTAGWTVRNGTFESGPPRLWSNVRLADTGVLGNFDAAPDGRILALLANGEPGDSLNVSVHFVRELEKRLGR